MSEREKREEWSCVPSIKELYMYMKGNAQDLLLSAAHLSHVNRLLSQLLSLLPPCLPPPS